MWFAMSVLPALVAQGTITEVKPSGITATDNTDNPSDPGKQHSATPENPVGVDPGQGADSVDYNQSDEPTQSPGADIS